MPKTDLEALGNQIRIARKKAYLTQEQLAERVHVSIRHIANIEKGKINPSYEILLAILCVLAVSLDALITPGAEDADLELKELNRIYLSCPPEMRKAWIDSVRSLAGNLAELSETLKNGQSQNHPGGLL